MNLFLAALAFQAPVALTKPDRALTEPFSQITSVRELRDGRVVVVDVKEKLVQIADFASGTVKTIGRNGSGPGEYAMPVGLVAMPGERTFVYDPMNQRFLELGAEGSVRGLVTFSSLIGLKGIPMMLMPAADAQGRLYFEGINPAAMGGTDSVAVLRWTVGRPQLDTVGFVGGMDFGIENKGGKVAFKAMKMFAPQEAWTATPTGLLARVTPMPYRIVWYEKGKPIPGPTVPYDPVPVTEADKEVLRSAFKQGLAAAGAAAAAMKIPEPEFAATKPPFSGRGAALPAPNGQIWVARSVRSKAPSEYDRFDGRGRLLGRVTLAPDAAVVGFGKQAVYVARKDNDDLMYLERYRMPN